MRRMRVSYVIVSHNRRERLLATLMHLAQTMSCEVEPWETWVVDNGSTDGSAEALAREFPDVKVIRRPRNEGVWARNYAIESAAGEYVVLLDDDSYPIERTVERSIEHLERNRRIAAVVGRVILPDGGLEGCAIPCVLLSGAVCMRREALEEVGGFAREFFRKAGEYDLSFRLLDAGWGIERFEDLIYRHDKFSGGRSAFTAHRMDLRNNLILAERYLPADLRRIYRADWTQRYAALARTDGQRAAARVARFEASCWRVREAVRGRRVLRAATIETIFQWSRQAGAVQEWARDMNVRSIVIADYSKNVYATFRAAQQAGLSINAIADDHPAFAGISYRGVPLASVSDALEARIDGVILSNINPAQVDYRVAWLRTHFDGPILRLWHPRTLNKFEMPTAVEVRA